MNSIPYNLKQKKNLLALEIAPRRKMDKLTKKMLDWAVNLDGKVMPNWVAFWFKLQQQSYRRLQLIFKNK